jgi:3-hydroxy-9,10-secoandrosta-1,3,5(10)-triene-9,17-dione monooxygenase
MVALSDADYAARARRLLPALRDRASDVEQLRQLPAETIADFQAAGLFRALQPKRYGGLEVDPVEFFDAVMTIGGVCASSAWVLGVLGVHSWQLGLFDPNAQADVWGTDSSALISSAYATVGKVETVEGGYVLSGSWPFSSGCDHSSWVFLGGIVPREVSEPRNDDDLPDIRTFLVPLADCTIVDNWHVAGLSGSGSKEIRVDRQFVPEYRTHRFLDVRTGDSPGLAENTSDLFKLPFGSLFCYAISTPILGVARGMYESFVAQAREKAQAAYQRGRKEDTLVQLRLARTAADLDGAVLQLWHNLADMQATVRRGDTIPLDRRSRYRWDAANAARIGTESVDLLFEASGGRAIFNTNPLQRAFRDVHAMRAHAMNNPDISAQVFGRAQLGLPNREFLI